MISVKEILRHKPPGVWHIQPDATVYEALELLAEKDVGALPVVHGGKLAGMFSERDYARKVALHGKSSRETTVRELMSYPVISIGPDETIETCMLLMTDHRIRHLPVLDRGRLVGMISIGDVLKSIIDDQRLTIQDLETYITGKPQSAIGQP